MIFWLKNTTGVLVILTHTWGELLLFWVTEFFCQLLTIQKRILLIEAWGPEARK